MEERPVAVWSGKKGREPRGVVLRGYQRIPAAPLLGPDGPNLHLPEAARAANALQS